MQNYILDHEGTGFPRPATTFFPLGDGAVQHSDLNNVIETYFDGINMTGDRIVSVALADTSRSLQSGYRRMVSTAGSVAVAVTGGSAGIAGYMFRIEMPFAVNPANVTYADLTAGSHLEVYPLPLMFAFGSAQWDYCQPLDLTSRDPAMSVFYGVVLQCAESAGVAHGYISAREVLVERPIMQPNK